jgi:hypothetical protein
MLSKAVPQFVLSRRIVDQIGKVFLRQQILLRQLNLALVMLLAYETLVSGGVDVGHAVVVHVQLGLVRYFAILQAIEGVQHHGARHRRVILVLLRLSFGHVALLTARAKRTLLLFLGSGDGRYTL